MKRPFREPYAIHWFRRDLRVEGNLALLKSFERFSGRVLGLFCFDPKFLARPDFSPDRFAFFLQSLDALRNELVERGGDLLVLDQGSDQSFAALMDSLARFGANLPSAVSFNRDYEPFARQRDERITALLTDQYGIEVQTEADHLLIEPWQIAKESGGFYQVYTPFSRRWMERLRSEEIQTRIKGAFEVPHSQFFIRWPAAVRRQLGDSLQKFIKENKSHVPLPRAGSGAAKARLTDFSQKLSRYESLRDYPARDGTSRLSIYLKNGSLSTAQIANALGLRSPSKFLSELVWREFYYHVLWHCPRVETGAFLEPLSGIEWENSLRLFNAWKEGRTGYPIVDAAMRQLQATGWMHNRLRMIVASFLVKDLLIDWRRGESWFMKKLLDGDLASNNGGWQWAASTGCDPQPYFRIFNPTLQSRKFDPEGEFIRKWAPELSSLSKKEIHLPRESGRPRGYPKPVVIHESRRMVALRLYRLAKEKGKSVS